MIKMNLNPNEQRSGPEVRPAPGTLEPQTVHLVPLILLYLKVTLPFNPLKPLFTISWREMLTLENGGSSLLGLDGLWLQEPANLDR